MNLLKGCPEVYGYWDNIQVPMGLVLGTTQSVCGHKVKYDFIAMQKLGPNLGKLFKLCNRKFSKETTAKIGIQMLGHIEHLHSLSYIHRDIKPENFVIGDFASCASKFEANKMAQCLLMIDLGLTSLSRRVDGRHIKSRIIEL